MYRLLFTITIFQLLLLGCQNSAPPPAVENGTPKKTIISGLHKETPNPFAAVDASPMDMSYYPAEYPKIKHGTNEPPVARIIYSRPQKHGRQMLGKELPYDSIWRLGANEGTELEFFKPATIQGKKIAAGRYLIYCIPTKDSWQLTLNTYIYSWGLAIDTAQDLHRFTIPVSANNPSAEFFTAVFESAKGGANLIFAWGDVVAKLPINF